MNKFNPEAIVCTDFSIDVVLFDGDLTPEECSDVFMKAVQEDYPIPMLNDVIILGTKEYYDENGIDVIYVHYSEDDFREVTIRNNIARGLLKFLADMEPPIGEDGLSLPPLPIHDDIEDIPF